MMQERFWMIIYHPLIIFVLLLDSYMIGMQTLSLLSELLCTYVRKYVYILLISFGLQRFGCRCFVDAIFIYCYLSSLNKHALSIHHRQCSVLEFPILPKMKQIRKIVEIILSNRGLRLQKKNKMCVKHTFETTKINPKYSYLFSTSVQYRQLLRCFNFSIGQRTISY